MPTGIYKRTKINKSKEVKLCSECNCMKNIKSGNTKCKSCIEKETKPQIKIRTPDCPHNKRIYNCSECRKIPIKKWRENNKDKYKATINRFRQKCKMQCYIHYSGNPPKCECCGEQNLNFLTIDHIDGSGKKHKKYIRDTLAHWLIVNGYPDGYRILCYNCNCGRSVNKGICPHIVDNEIRFSKEIQNMKYYTSKDVQKLLKEQREEIIEKIKNEKIKNFGLINSKGEGGAILVEDIINIIKE